MPETVLRYSTVSEDSNTIREIYNFAFIESLFGKDKLDDSHNDLREKNNNKQSLQ